MVFDLDGTLVVMKLRIREAKVELLRRLRTLGFELGNESPETPTARILERLGEGGKRRALELVDEVFSPYELKAAEEAEVRRGVKEALNRLREMRMKLAVATNNGRKAVEKTLEKTSLTLFFDVVITRNEAGDMKPRGKPVEEAVRRLGVRSWEAVYVGDTSFDVEAAREAGTKSIAITGGAHSLERLRAAQPDIIIHEMSQLPDAVRKLGGET